MTSERPSRGDASNDAADNSKNWYSKLLSRRVDLVGDYAGNELFLIEGDSLLLNAFSDDKLDFTDGFQILHAAYNVENFLQNLLRRKCNFHVAFFDNHEECCVPPSTLPENKDKYLLARAAIIRHLQKNIGMTQPRLSIKTFQSFDSDGFTKYLEQTGLYFVMCHDGAVSVPPQSAKPPVEDVSEDSDEELTESGEDSDEDGSEDDPEDDESEDDESEDDASSEEDSDDEDARNVRSRRAFRNLIHWCIRKGYNVALINGLEWRDTKVITVVLEGHSFRHGGLGAGIRNTNSTSTTEDPASTRAWTSYIQKLAQHGIGASPEGQSKFTERECLAVLTVAKMLSQDECDTQTASKFLLHIALLRHYALTERRVTATKTSDGEEFLQEYASSCLSLMRTWNESELAVRSSIVCDVADLLDGRLFNACVASKTTAVMDDKIEALLKALISATLALCGIAVPNSLHNTRSQKLQSTTNSQNHQSRTTSRSMSVLPFNNPVFDTHLVSVHLSTDDTLSQVSESASRVFRELSHWHNAKRPLDRKIAPDAKQAFYANRRNQRWMAEMMAYAASLTNAVGNALEPETVVTGSSGAPKTSSVDSSKRQDLQSNAKQSKADIKPKKKGPAVMTVKEKIAAERAIKEDANAEKHINAWYAVCKTLDKEQDPGSRYFKTKEYLNSFTGAKRDAVEAEVRLFMLDALLSLWIRRCKEGKKEEGFGVAALLWNTITDIDKVKAGLTKTVAAHVQSAVKRLGLPAVSLSASASADRKFPFTFVLDSYPALDVSLPMTSKDFQLMHCGPFFDRNIDSAPDSRVPFEPDGWQRKVLDEIDAKRSLFVVAPTSAGKTFISFYAMKQILESGDDGVLVYVAPTKALVNQIAAEVQARFSKSFKYGGKSVWGIHTRDYRINNPTGCQVLVTVPHILQIMLLAPSNANSWSRRVKRIIFDEIHCIGQADDGIVWEQLLLLAPCPIIALSATVGNPEEFNSWVASTQRSINIDLTMIQHHQRYSDLRKFIYHPPKDFTFNGLGERPMLAPLGLDGAAEFTFMHPVASLINRSRGMPDDLSLEARDCFTLWQSMVKHRSRRCPIAESLAPHKALPDIVRKADIIQWEASLKRVLKEWMRDQDSPFNAVLEDLSKPHSEQRAGGAVADARPFDPDGICETTLPLLATLHAQDALPAILFNYDRSMCEKICTTLMSQLVSAEQQWKESSPKWKAKVTAWEQWKKEQEKKPKKAPPKTSKKKGGKGDDEDGDERDSKLDLQKDAATDASPFASFNPDAPVEGFHFADLKKLLPSELQQYCYQLERRGLPAWLGEGLARGIGIHHAGMNRKYRQVVEILFRKGFLRVVIATGTLALGINMPCKTVVFSGDSVFLTALNYRQAAGRAGRRGFDMLGNVVFQGVPYGKVCRLLSSRLPDLNGHFPITTTLVLRLFALLHESKSSQYAVRAITSLLSQPRLYLGGDESKMTVLHHLRFSIEYLRRQQLLDTLGRPLNFAGCVSHLYFTENSSFAFHALLKEGYFHQLCKGVRHRPKSTLRDLMLVMAHLFGRQPCRQADREFIKEVVKRSPSIVFLPPLPAKAARVLRRHNNQTLQIFSTYVKTFVDQHIDYDDSHLPLTGMKFGGDASSASTPPGALPHAAIRSSFVALSGHGDNFASISDLCHTTRSGVFLEEAVIPYISLYPEESDVPLNAYLYDFFKHGDVTALDKANRIRRGEVWFLLNDFSLILATIITSLMNFMKLTPESDVDLLDVMGSGDVFEESKDDKVAELENEPLASGKESAGAKQQQAQAKKKATTVEDSWDVEATTAAVGALRVSKAKAADSWEDHADAVEAKIAKHKAKRTAEQKEANAAARDGDPGKGLMNVLRAFQMLKQEFDGKFKAMWA